jgi:hypothetical protein
MSSSRPASYPDSVRGLRARTPRARLRRPPIADCRRLPPAAALWACAGGRRWYAADGPGRPRGVWTDAATPAPRWTPEAPSGCRAGRARRDGRRCGGRRRADRRGDLAQGTTGCPCRERRCLRRAIPEPRWKRRCSTSATFSSCASPAAANRAGRARIRCSPGTRRERPTSRPKGLHRAPAVEAPRFFWCAIAGGMRVGYPRRLRGRRADDSGSQRARPPASFSPAPARARSLSGRIAAESARFNLGQDSADHQPADAAAALPRCRRCTPRLFFSRGGDEEIDGSEDRRSSSFARMRVRPSPPPPRASTCRPAGAPGSSPRAGASGASSCATRPERAAGDGRSGSARTRASASSRRRGCGNGTRRCRSTTSCRPASSSQARLAGRSSKRLATYSDLRLFSVETSEDDRRSPD